ncbi:MAG: chemotaxis protein CheX [Deferrisomatales bacterium]
MNAEHVNAFLTPSVQVIRKMAGVDVRLGKVQIHSAMQMTDHLSIVIGLQGGLSGAVILTAQRAVAAALAARVAGEALEEPGGEECRAILAELANTIVGNATGHLYELGIRQSITPPTVVSGSEVRFDFGAGTRSVRIPLDTEVGRVDVIVSLTRRS